MSTFNLLNGYVGSKGAYVSKIKSLFDLSCTKYIEPFVGGGAIYFSHYNGQYREEVINDQNPNLALLYSALTEEETQNETIQKILEIEKDCDERTAREKFNNARKKLLSKNTALDDIPKAKWPKLAQNIFIVFSQSFNRSGKNYSKLDSDEKYRNKTKRNLHNAVARLSTHPMVLNEDGVEIVKRFKDDDKAQIFLDPPYVGLYRSNPKLYQNEMAGLIEHIRLIRDLAGSKSAVVLCGYRSEMEGVPTVYDILRSEEGWHCFKLKDSYKKCKVVKAGEKKPKCCEYVWTNRVPERAKLYISMKNYKEDITEEEYWEKVRLACKKGLIEDKQYREYADTYFELYGENLF